MTDKRQITISLQIENIEIAQEIWDLHKNNIQFLGCKILGIREGRLSKIIEDELRKSSDY